jgi:tetratricopeptide (TPR) repeat protein
MSLLLQALQKAAKGRDGGGAEPEAPSRPGEIELEVEPQRVEPPKLEAAGGALALAEEAIFEPDPMPEPEPDAAAPSDRYDSDRNAQRAQAATILRASETKRQTWFDRIRDRPVHALAIAAGIFLPLYAAYVYLQIAHPALLRGEFVTRALQARTPPPAPTPISPPPAAPPPAVAAAEPPAPADIAAPAAPASPPAPGEAPAAAPAAGMAADAEAKPTKGGKPRREVAEAAPRERAPAPEPAPRRTARPRDAEDELGDQVNVRGADTRPAGLAAGLMEAWQALQEGRFDQAESLYQSVLQAEPQNVDAVLGLAAIAARQGRTEQAMRQYERALELEPRNATAQAGLIAIVGQADPQLSETRLKQLIAREPSGYLYFSLGNVHARQAQWPQAQQAYFQAYQLQPDNPDYAYNLAIGLERLNQPKIALSYYRKALELRGLKGNASFDQSRVQERVTQLAARLSGE